LGEVNLVVDASKQVMIERSEEVASKQAMIERSEEVENHMHKLRE
jgi:hypothetical protein